MPITRREKSIYEYIGSSFDTKPVGDVPVLSTYEEKDTGKLFFFQNGMWNAEVDKDFTVSALPKLQRVMEDSLVELRRIRWAMSKLADMELEMIE